MPRQFGSFDRRTIVASVKTARHIKLFHCIDCYVNIVLLHQNVVEIYTVDHKNDNLYSTVYSRPSSKIKNKNHCVELAPI